MNLDLMRLRLIVIFNQFFIKRFVHFDCSLQLMKIETLNLVHDTQINLSNKSVFCHNNVLVSITLTQFLKIVYYPFHL